MGNDERALDLMRRDLDELDPMEETAKAVAAGGPWADWSLDREIWYLRVHLGLTQGELSRRSGISPARISRIEAGADLKISTLRALWAALGYQPLILPEPIGRKKVGRPYRIQWRNRTTVGA